MKRILRKHWDETNGRLTVNYFQVYRNEVGRYTTTRLRRFYSPSFLKTPKDAKGKMSDRGEDLWFTENQAKELLGIFKEANKNGKANDSRRSKKFR